MKLPATIGVDNGSSGATVFLGPGGPVGILNPFVRGPLRPIVDNSAVSQFMEYTVRDYWDEVTITTLIEVPQIRMGKGGAAGAMNSRKTVSSIWWLAGCLDTALRAASSRLFVDYCQCWDWQAAILHPYMEARGIERPKGKGTHERLKEISIAYVSEKYGRDFLIPSPRHRVPNDGLADACCIAEYARMDYKPYVRPAAKVKKKTGKGE